jgi:hypothetical protein
MYLIFNFNNKIPIVIGLVLLLVCPFLLIFKKEAVANGLAIWAYYFLVIGVVLQLIEFVKSPVSGVGVKEAEPQTGLEKVAQPVFKYNKRAFWSQYGAEEKKYLKKRRWIIAVVASLIVLSLAVVGFTQKDRISRLIWGVSETEEVVTEQPEEKEVTQLEIDKAAISIQILNGNGKEGSALKMKEELEDKGFKVGSIGEADNYDYKQTIIKYKLGKRDEADLVQDSIPKNESVVLKQLISGQDFDIIIIVGADQLLEEKEVDKSNLRLMVENGCGIEGAAARMKDKLAAAGYVNIDIGDAKSTDYTNSIVYYRTDYRKQAEQVASDIGGTSVDITEDPTLGDTYDILVIVGISEGGI